MPDNPTTAKAPKIVLPAGWSEALELLDAFLGNAAPNELREIIEECKQEQINDG